jgi:four helix bundle protein
MAKPFDIRERTFLFACDVVSAFPARRPLDPPSWRVWSQLVAAGTSVGAHLEEADAASSRAHFISLNRGALRELREARYWLRLIAATKLSGHDRVDAMEREAGELVAIVSTIVKRASAARQR